MQFIDCNAFLGTPRNGSLYKPVDAAGMVAAMDRAGIQQALVWHLAQMDLDVVMGNELLMQGIAGCRDRLIPCWSLLPHHTGELGDLGAWFGRAVQSGVRAMRSWATYHHYLLRQEVLGPVLERMIACRMPLLLSSWRGTTWKEMYDLLTAVPELTLVICDTNCWGEDRHFRPLIERYPNVYLELSGYLLDGGIEAFVKDYGPTRLLWGSNFPQAYHGSMMLALRHAEISDADKAAIAGGNMLRLMEAVKL